MAVDLQPVIKFVPEDVTPTEETDPYHSSASSQPPRVKRPVTSFAMKEKLVKSRRIIDDVMHPWGIAVNTRGEIIVAEFNGHCISVFNLEGERLRSFGKKGSGEGQFNCPCGVAVDVQGNIIVADYNNHRVQKFTSDGTFIKAVGQLGENRHDFNCPIGVGIHPLSGNVYVVDNRNHRIQVLSSDLSFSSRFGKRGHGNGEFFHPWGVAFDAAGKVYVADGGNHRIQVFKSNKFLKKFGREGQREGELSWPSSIIVDYDDVVYVTENGNDRLSTFTAEGKYLMSAGDRGNHRGDEGFNNPRGVAVGEGGEVYVSDSTHNCVCVY